MRIFRDDFCFFLLRKVYVRDLRSVNVSNLLYMCLVPFLMNFTHSLNFAHSLNPAETGPFWIWENREKSKWTIPDVFHDKCDTELVLGIKGLENCMYTDQKLAVLDGTIGCTSTCHFKHDIPLNNFKLPCFSQWRSDFDGFSSKYRTKCNVSNEVWFVRVQFVFVLIQNVWLLFYSWCKNHGSRAQISKKLKQFIDCKIVIKHSCEYSEPWYLVNII